MRVNCKLLERRKFSLRLFSLNIPNSEVKIFPHFLLTDLFMHKGDRPRQAPQRVQEFLQQLKYITMLVIQSPKM